MPVTNDIVSQNLLLFFHHPEDDFWGSIYTDEVDNDIIQSWKVPRPEVPGCENLNYIRIAVS